MRKARFADQVPEHTGMMKLVKIETTGLCRGVIFKYNFNNMTRVRTTVQGTAIKKPIKIC
eukprot:snap_masked-scaffold_72-processed-gene-0.16-mRNA-1 protein AED:1.00 eAED:1.00 QI:0/-1/0/0/-1/1/1/0/59